LCWFYFRFADRRPSKVISTALSASFHRLDHRWRPRPVGSRLRMARYTHFRAAVSVVLWPRALTALRIRASMDSMAFVVQTTVRMWVSNCRNGTNSGHADSHSLMIAGYRSPPRLGEGDERIQGGRLARGGVDRFEILGQPPSASWRHSGSCCGADARLGDRLRPHRFDCRGQALESVADHHADILRATVFDFGEHPGPKLPSPSPCPPAHNPRMSRVPSTVTASAM
jgi:hypothetical protein